MKKRLVILGMIFMMTATVGCGKSNDNSAGNTNGKTQVQSNPSTQNNSDKKNNTEKEDIKTDNNYKSADEITMDDLMNHAETPAEDFVFNEDPNYDDIILNQYVGNDPIVVIPDEIDGYKVSQFNSIFTNNENIVAVRVGNNITEIKHGAFGNCKNLKYVVLGKSVVTLGGSTFVNTNLQELVLNEGLQKMGTDEVSDLVYAPNVNSKIDLKIPESVTEMHVSDFNLIVKAGSYAETYAKEHAESNRLTYTVE